MVDFICLENCLYSVSKSDHATINGSITIKWNQSRCILCLIVIHLNLDESVLWAAAWPNQQNDLCAQWRLRSAWTSTQSDQSLHCPHEKAWVLSYRLIWVFAGCTCHFVGFVMRRLNSVLDSNMTNTVHTAMRQIMLNTSTCIRFDDRRYFDNDYINITSLDEG